MKKVSKSQLVLIMIFGHVLGIVLLATAADTYSGAGIYLIFALAAFFASWYLFIEWRKSHPIKEEVLKHHVENTDFYVIPTWKTFLLFIVTLGFYKLYWWYRQWEFYNKHESLHKVSPGGRSFFSPFFAFSFNKHLQERSNVVNASFPKVLGSVLAFFHIFSFVLPIGFLYILFAQFNINKISSKKEEKEYSKSALRFSLITSILIVCLIILRIISEILLYTPTTEDIVDSIKEEMLLPSGIDDNTTLVDIISEPNAIRYIYNIHGIDDSELNAPKLKQLLLPDVCANKDVKTLLDKNINIKYWYSFFESKESYLVNFSKSDCLYY